MARQICPKCQGDSFVWSCEDNEPLTQWGCGCGYIALEDESLMRTCSKCSNKTQSYMKDFQSIYWWCSFCNSVDYIKKAPQQ